MLETLKDLFDFLIQNKKWWLLPIIIILLIVGLLIVSTSGTALSPFIYTLF